MATRQWNLIGLIFLCGCAALRIGGLTHPYVRDFRIINLGSSAITAISVYGWPLHEARIRVPPGYMVTGGSSFAGTGGQVKYSIYWMLEDGSIHSEVVDVRDRLPEDFEGPIVFAIQDIAVSVSWSNTSQAFREYVKGGLHGDFSSPTYHNCGGALFEKGIRGMVTSDARVAAPATATGKACYLDLYIPKDRPPKVDLNDSEGQRAAEMWSKTVQQMWEERK